MRKSILFILIIILGLAIWQKDIIINFVVQNLLYTEESYQISANQYYKNSEFLLLKETDDFTPSSQEEFNDLFYTILNKGVTSFSFYCDFAYESCVDDFKDYIKNSAMPEIINNYVHPYNSFDTISVIPSMFNKITVEINKLYSEAEIDVLNNKIDTFIKNNITSNMSDRNKIKLFHDYVINNSKYDTNFTLNTDRNTYPTRPYTAYGALVEKKAICSGYSDAMAIFLSKIGIKNYKIASDEHIWNYVYVNGNWYHLDLTWDDPVTSNNSNLLIHDFFLIDTNELRTKDTSQHTYSSKFYLEAK